MNYKKVGIAGCVGIALFILSIHPVFGLDLREEILFSVVQVAAINKTGDSTTGSGTTISRDGLVLTNYHVVFDKETDEPNEQVSICYTVSQFEPPRCVATAAIIAFNKEFDLALIKPDKRIGTNGEPTGESFGKYWKKTGQHFYAVNFRNSNNFTLPKILSRITVWGYPSVGGSTITVSSGFISGFNIEEINEEDSLVKFIKTDASVNPGNSGGASFDEFFSFIGVPSNAWAGQLGFIIPVETVVGWIKHLDEQGIVHADKIESLRAYEARFTDIPAEDEYLNSLAGLMRYLKIMNPYPDGSFGADKPVTRAEGVTMVLAAARINVGRNLGSPGVSSPENCDYKEKHWYTRYICTAGSRGWIDESDYDATKIMTEREFTQLIKKAFVENKRVFAGADLLTRESAAELIFEMLIR